MRPAAIHKRGPIHARDPVTGITHTAFCLKHLLLRARILREDFLLFKFFSIHQLTEVSTGPMEGSKGKGSTSLLAVKVAQLLLNYFIKIMQIPSP